MLRKELEFQVGTGEPGGVDAVLPDFSTHRWEGHEEKALKSSCREREEGHRGRSVQREAGCGSHRDKVKLCRHRQCWAAGTQPECTGDTRKRGSGHHSGLGLRSKHPSQRSLRWSGERIRGDRPAEAPEVWAGEGRGGACLPPNFLFGSVLLFSCSS